MADPFTIRHCLQPRALPILRTMIKGGLSSTLLLAIAAFGGACSPLPDIPPVTESAAPAPQLVPLDILMAAVPAARATNATGDALAAKAARLQTRANLMRGPVLDPETRRKLAAAIARGDA